MHSVWMWMCAYPPHPPPVSDLETELQRQRLYIHPPRDSKQKKKQVFLTAAEIMGSHLCLFCNSLVYLNLLMMTFTSYAHQCMTCRCRKYDTDAR